MLHQVRRLVFLFGECFLSVRYSSTAVIFAVVV